MRKMILEWLSNSIHVRILHNISFQSKDRQEMYLHALLIIIFQRQKTIIEKKQISFFSIMTLFLMLLYLENLERSDYRRYLSDLLFLGGLYFLIFAIQSLLLYVFDE